LKLVTGNPGKRKLNTHEPKPRVAIPRCPAHLDDEARREWKRMGRKLARMGLLTEIDHAAFAGYCQSWSRWKQAEEQVRKLGLVVKSPNNFPIQNPYLPIANKALEQIRQFIVEFGLSPASRSRVAADIAQSSPLGANAGDAMAAKYFG